MISFKNSFFGKLYILSNPDSNAEMFLPKLHLIGLLIIHLDIAHCSKMIILEIESIKFFIFKKKKIVI